MNFYLTRKAKSDLKAIARYTQKQWGVDQRNTYLKQIDQAFHDLAKSPDQGRNCDHIRPGYRKYKVGRHYIFYRDTSSDGVIQEDVEIVRILHERMDITNRLRED